MPLRSRQGPRQRNGPQANEGCIVDACIPQYTCSNLRHAAMVSALVGDRRCEGSQSQGQSSWMGLKGIGHSQGGPGPTFPVKSGKHGQSQGTGVHISSPTFEANPLVPTTPLDDTINMLSPGPLGPPKPQRTLSEGTGSSQVKSAPPAPDLTRGGAGPGLLCGLPAQYCTASQAQNAQATAELSLTLQPAAGYRFWR